MNQRKYTYNVYKGSRHVGQVKATNRKEAREKARQLGNRSNSLQVVKSVN